MSHRDLQKIQEVTPGCLTGSLSVSSVQHVLLQLLDPTHPEKETPPVRREFHVLRFSSPDQNELHPVYKRPDFLLQFIQQKSVLMEIDMLLQSKFTTKYNENKICLIDYLKSQLKPGSNFFKSKYIAKDTGLSSKEVGTIMALLSEICPEYKIERYSYSNSTTWLVTTPQV